jgi:hypothetical protein
MTGLRRAAASRAARAEARALRLGSEATTIAALVARHRSCRMNPIWGPSRVAICRWGRSEAVSPLLIVNPTGSSPPTTTRLEIVVEAPTTANRRVRLPISPACRAPAAWNIRTSRGRLADVVSAYGSAGDNC